MQSLLSLQSVDINHNIAIRNCHKHGTKWKMRSQQDFSFCVFYFEMKPCRNYSILWNRIGFSVSMDAFYLHLPEEYIFIERKQEKNKIYIYVSCVYVCRCLLNSIASRKWMSYSLKPDRNRNRNVSFSRRTFILLALTIYTQELKWHIS